MLFYIYFDQLLNFFDVNSSMMVKEVNGNVKNKKIIIAFFQIFIFGKNKYKINVKINPIREPLVCEKIIKKDIKSCIKRFMK